MLSNGKHSMFNCEIDIIRLCGWQTLDDLIKISSQGPNNSNFLKKHTKYIRCQMYFYYKPFITSNYTISATDLH